MKVFCFRLCLLVGGASLLSSCALLSGGGSLGAMSNPLAQVQQKAEDRVSAEIASAAGITAMERKMMFSVMYSQVFYIGGFGADYYDLEETQGSTWRIESGSNEGVPSFITAERALLKELPDGDRWWYLSWADEEEKWEFEALMTKDQETRKIRYYNPDVKRVEEAVFDLEKEPDDEDETAPPEEVPSSEYSLEDLKQNSVGTEKITVSGTTYTCEKIEWDYYDEEEGERYLYHWWIDPEAPGGLVRYNWSQPSSGDYFKGELVSLKKGYTTRFDSF